MKNISTLLILFLTMSIYAQKDWKQHSRDNYEISYPKEWKLDTSGQMNSSFILFSEGKAADSFNENINMVIQDLSLQGIDLDAFFDISKKQINNDVQDGRMIYSRKEKRNNLEYYTTVWEAKMGKAFLKFKQHYYMKNDMVYILTLTTLPDTFIDYEAIADEILKSFKLK
ncbi:hypothetical protein SAMN04489761_3815 [Tenacibaculum sp. MAR_2009_124]|uniref:hypothetical protein n=1 Tax=Tenacibaculum sp. MAR_2009_124 TaxID=1250059 RepID=UPI00089D7319|nr:hypothetical protein [Tenacibaculum sp. MAR_2009_124]SEC86729.1 hypothetical protein SAMN04489761_3815 [Tenacibaculum sp. MAR_2009_124]